MGTQLCRNLASFNFILFSALLPQSLSEEEQFAAKLRSAQNFMRKIEAELKELIRDYHRMKNRRKRKLQQQHKNGMAETGAQINAACIAVVDAFADSPQADFKDSLSSSSYNDATSHVVSPVTTQQPNVVSANMYNLPKKARMEPPPVLTLQEANELKEQISQLHPGVFMSSAINCVRAEILKALSFFSSSLVF